MGVLFIIGGILGFLPILGFWMLPLGIAFIALDIPPTRKRIHRWKEELHEKAYGSAAGPTPESSSES